MTEFQYEKNKVSILIPVYNRELLLEECIQSALNQTYDNFEVVIVDNASTDQTWKVCQAWAERDDRIRIYRNDENIGPVRNWQRCLDEATGEFCKFLFSDDKLMPECLTQLVNLIKTPGCSIALGAILIGKNENTSNKCYSQADYKIFNQLQYINELIRGTLPVSPCAVLMKTASARKNLKLDFPTRKKQRYAEHGAGPDVILILEELQNGNATVTERPVGFFRAHEGSFSIGELKSEIVDSYTSAIAWFLSVNYGEKYRIRYVAVEWIRYIKKTKKWVSPFRFSKDYEGKGTCTELIAMILWALKWIVFKKISLSEL